MRLTVMVRCMPTVVDGGQIDHGRRRQGSRRRSYGSCPDHDHQTGQYAAQPFQLRRSPVSATFSNSMLFANRKS